MEGCLVLTAVGIAAEAVQRGGQWELVVAAEDAGRAGIELDEYRCENQGRGGTAAPPPVYSGAAAAIIVAGSGLLLVAALLARAPFGVDLLAIGRMQAGALLAGQWWRSITALTLHLDAGHLVSNLVLGGLLGGLACRTIGGGVGLLVLVLAGALGNTINALLQPPNHTSIGASTAVFAALGVTVAHALRRRPADARGWLKRWSPLVAGLVLLGFIGVGGQRTDVGAHAAGWLAGLVIGWFVCRLPEAVLSHARLQCSAGGAAVGIVAAAWCCGIAAYVIR